MTSKGAVREPLDLVGHGVQQHDRVIGNQRMMREHEGLYARLEAEHRR